MSLPILPPLSVQIFISILFLAFSIYIPFLYLFYQSKHLHPINARLPYVVLALDFNVLGIAANEFVVALFEPQFICAIRQMTGVFYILAFMLYNYRLFHLLFHTKITKNIVLHQQKVISSFIKEEDKNRWESNWYVRNRFLVQPTLGIYFFIGLTIFVLILQLLSIVLDPNTMKGNICNFKDLVPSIMTWYLLISEVLCTLIAILLGILLRSTRHRDAFGIKSEFIVVVYTTGIAVAIYAVLNLFTSARWLASIFILFAVHCLIFFSTVWPYYLSQKELEAQRDQRIALRGGVGDDADELETPTITNHPLFEVLTQPEGFQTFLKYLETEFSTENLLFWDAVEHLKQSAASLSASLLLQSITKIMKQYILNEAPCQVNLSSNTRVSLISAFHTIQDSPFLLHAETTTTTTFSPTSSLPSPTILSAESIGEGRTPSNVEPPTGRDGDQQRESKRNRTTSFFEFWKSDTIPTIDENQPSKVLEADKIQDRKEETEMVQLKATTTTIESPSTKEEIGREESRVVEGESEPGNGALLGVISSLGEVKVAVEGEHKVVVTTAEHGEARARTRDGSDDELGEQNPPRRRTELEEMMVHLFDQAQIQIYNLMNLDSYPRFQRTKFYKKFRRSLGLLVSSSMEVNMNHV